MNLRKLFSVLLAICIVLSFAGCGGGGGGSDDEEEAATWPVEYYMAVGGGSPVSAMRTAPSIGTYKYIYFYKDNTYKSGDLNNGTLTQTGSGSYSGGDPHKNATLSLTGTFEGSNLNGESVSISSGSLTIAGKTFTAGGSSNGGNGGGSGGGDVTPPAVSWPVRYLTGNPEVPGMYFYIDFNKNGTFAAGEHDGSKVTSTLGGGTYTGDDPHGDGSMHIKGAFGEAPPIDDDFTISGGVLSLLTLNWERQ